MRIFEDYLHSEEEIYKTITKYLYEESFLYNNIKLSEDSNKKSCIIENCNQPAICKGLCNGHYLRSRKNKDLTLPLKNKKSQENCTDCGEKINKWGGFGRCRKHFKARRKDLIKQAFVALFNNQCLICNNSYDLAAYDFHHLNQEDKLDHLSIIIVNNGIKEISKEMSKCVLLCSNCHRILHNKNKTI